MSTQKTPRALSLGVFFRALLVLLLLQASWVQAFCPVPKVDEQVQLARVVDGDTLVLTDGRKVRVLGINSPEMASGGKSAEPLAVEARRAAQKFLSKSKSLGLVFDQDPKDRYGRLLAHVYDEQGRSLAAQLLREGLAFHIVVPPNQTQHSCLHQQEEVARKKALGVWGHAYWQPKSASQLTSDDQGFMRIRGRVTSVSGKKEIWIELDGPLVLHVSARDKQLFGSVNWKEWKGKSIEVRGWVVNRETRETRSRGLKPLRLDLRSPYAIRLEARD